MTPDEEIADIERQLFGMSHGDFHFVPLTQRLIALRLAQKDQREQLSSQAPEPKDNWHNKPLGQIFIAVAGGFVVLCLTYWVLVHLGADSPLTLRSSGRSASAAELHVMPKEER